MTIRISDDVVFRELSGEMVLLDLASGTYFGLNAVGSRIWRGLADLESPDTIVDALRAEYAVDEADLRRDVETLIGTLRDRGLIRVTDERAPAAD